MCCPRKTSAAAGVNCSKPKRPSSPSNRPEAGCTAGFESKRGADKGGHRGRTKGDIALYWLGAHAVGEETCTSHFSSLRGQTQYPRYEFFQQIVEVFRRSGRCAPVFNDKHLSWRWDWAK